jgi:hypothetical protein
MNFMDSFDTLLNANRDQLLEGYRFADPHTLTFLHLTFDDIREGTPDQQGGDLKNAVRGISTDFRISDDDAKRIDLAVDALFDVNKPCLSSIRDIVRGSSGPARACTNSEEQ